MAGQDETDGEENTIVIIDIFEIFREEEAHPQEEGDDENSEESDSEKRNIHFVVASGKKGEIKNRDGQEHYGGTEAGDAGEF